MFRSGYCHCGICVVNSPQRNTGHLWQDRRSHVTWLLQIYKILKPNASFVPKTFILVPNHVHKKRFLQEDKLKNVMDKGNK